jgi:hypothetical protein
VLKINYGINYSRDRILAQATNIKVSLAYFQHVFGKLGCFEAAYFTSEKSFIAVTLRRPLQWWWLVIKLDTLVICDIELFTVVI